MTESAKETLELVQKIGNKVFLKAFDGIDAEEIGRMTGTLKRMRENLNLSQYETHAEAQPASKVNSK